MQTDHHALVLVTVGDAGEARDIARSLVSGRLAAGVQMFPIQSVYEWDDEIIEDSEVLLIAKTRRDRIAAIEEAVVSRHSYEVAPVVMVPVIGGLDSYLEWIDGIVSAD